MNMNEYQVEAKKTAGFPVASLNGQSVSWVYPALGLAGEAGEVAEKLKKVFRNKDGVMDIDDITAITKELGDVLWYVATLADEIGVTLEEVAMTNVLKLRSRQERGVIKRSGDER